MKTGTGIVKKYSREYNRTLKNGEKKKYTTKQIQITVPKNEDIYENKEEVLIIPNSEIKEFKNLEEEIDSLKVANYLYVRKVNELKEELENTSNSNSAENEKEIAELKTIILEQNNSLNEMKNKYKNNDSVAKENEDLKIRYSDLLEEYESVRKSYAQISIKYDNLKQENLNTKTGYAEIFEINENLEKDYDSLIGEYNDLVDKFNQLQDELYYIKSHHSHEDYIAGRVREFILRKY